MSKSILVVKTAPDSPEGADAYNDWYDNTHLAAIRHVSLTSVDQPRRDMGRVAAERLTARIEDPLREPLQTLVVPHLVIRATSGRAPQ